MKNDKLNNIWDSQDNDLSLKTPEAIIKKAKTERKGQFLSITIMTLTVIILISFTIYTTINQWNDFTLGLILMISSLVFRILLEFLSLFRKESQLISLDNKSYRSYLKKHYRYRQKINYIVTPICFAVYIFGFKKLLPFFKNEFSSGFYTYIIISGIISLIVIALIVANSILKENRFMKHLDKK